MGTRCDFYVGRGEQAEWLGSYPFDGYPDGVNDSILDATDEAAYRAAVAEKMKDARATTPDMGWPWPWNDSRTTDYAYAFEDSKVHCSRFGCEWFDPRKEPKETAEEDEKKAVFPNMEAVKNVTLGSRSGLIVVKLE